MRDFIWTIIVIWLVYKLLDVFKSKQKPAENTQNANFSGNTNPSSNHESGKRAKEKHLNEEGDYVDFEEIK